MPAGNRRHAWFSHAAPHRGEGQPVRTATFDVTGSVVLVTGGTSASTGRPHV